MGDQSPADDDEFEALTQFLYLAPVGLAQTTLDGEIAMMNPLSAQLLMPLSRDGSLSNLFAALEGVAPELRHMAANFEPAQGSICDGLPMQLTAGIPGKTDPQILSLTLLKLSEKSLMAVLNDISAQVKRDRQLSHNLSWFNALLTGIKDYALVSLDASGNVDDWNESIQRVTGFSREAAAGRPYSIFYTDDAKTQHVVADRLRDANNNGWCMDEGWRQKADGSQYWGSCMLVPLQKIENDTLSVMKAGARPGQKEGTDEAKPGYCLVVRDISDQREASENMRKAMTCDFLTGIANRRTFFEAAELEIARWQRAPRALSLIMFDADHFKAINDTYGHPTGDAVLRHLAGLLTALFRQIDVVARVGGEEFAILLPSTDLTSALAVANRLREAVEAQPLDVDGVTIRYTISGGIATMDDTVTGLDALMKRADKALYAAKKAGRNRIESWPEATPVYAMTP